MKNNLRRMLEGLSPGDLICCEWLDASTGKSSSCGGVIDIPVWSWGVYVGLFGSKNKHIILAQNSFQYSDGVYDVDYTAIPVSWTLSVKVLVKAHFPAEAANKLVNSFLLKDKRVFTRSNRPRTFQQRLSTHGRPN